MSDIPPPTVPGCPPAAALHAFHRGDLPPAAVDALVAHLAGCAVCEAALQTLDAREESVVADLRRLPPADADAASGPAAGDVIAGRYTLVGPLGEGGMGSVWRADQFAPVRRPVAVKLIKPGMDSRQVLRRFAAERQALALMDHPHIATVLDAGTTPAGRPFFAMELVEGQPITAYCDARTLTPRQRLELFIPVCRAVQHAHQKGVVHRDLKPGNVLVTEVDGRPVPKVIDFGIAKATGPALADGTLQTGLGAVVGTPEYMAPEQAGGTADVDTRADVYALGVLLYELLTGTTPLTRRRAHQAAVLEVLRLVREEEPPAPSSRLSTADALPTIAANRGTEPARLARLLRGDLDWVVLKALEKDRGRRYESAGGFARDVERYLQDEPVEAGRPTRGYRLRRFARRNRGPVLAAGLVVAALLAGLAGTGYGLVRADAARRAEAAERGRAEHEGRKAAGMFRFVRDRVFAAANPVGVPFGLGRDVTLKTALEASLPAVAAQFPDEPEVEAELRATLGSALLDLGDPAAALGQFTAAEQLFAAAGPDRPAAVDAANYVTHALIDLRRFPEAIARAEPLVDRSRAALGPDHPLTLMAETNLANAYHAVDRQPEARRLTEAVLARRRAVLGPDHKDTLISLNNMANFLADDDKLADCLAMTEECLAGRRRTLGPDHIHTLTTEINLGLTLTDLGRHDEAAAVQADAQARCQRVLGPDHAKTRHSRRLALAAAARVHLLGGRLPAAEPLLREALAVSRAAYPGPAAHPNTRDHLRDLGLLLVRAGRPGEAEPLLREAAAPGRPSGRKVGRVGLGLAVAARDPAAGEADIIAGFAELKAGGADLAPWDRQLVGQATDWLAGRCAATGRPADAARWRAERAKFPPEPAPAPRPAGGATAG